MSRKYILVVEDDEVIRTTMQALLESEGYAVECAADGHEGIQALRGIDPPPGLILLDMTMPVMDGFQFRSEQQRDVKLSLIPVLVMTADGHIEEKTARVGASGFIKKPFDLNHLVRMVQEHYI